MAAQERAEMLAVLSTGRPVVATRCTRTFRVHDYVLSRPIGAILRPARVRIPYQIDSTPESHAHDRLIREPEGATERGIFAVTDI